MFGINWRQTVRKTILISLIAVVLTMGMAGCGDRLPEQSKLGNEKKAIPTPVPAISEVSPPITIQKLGRVLDKYQPQVTILSPKPQEVLQDNNLTVQLQVKDLPIFKSDLGLGPHLEVILDNQPYKEIYDLDQPLTIKDLEPGTHTLRVFANRPWEESFKNQGAYAQTTFQIFTKTPNNNPNSNQPLLTYNSPTGTLGAEPILLDFYLTNAPLHFVAQENPEDEIADWRIKVTINGTSFTSDRWQPMYLKGLKPGKNWVQLEYLDELGNPINNAYNNTARLIIYQPNGQDNLSKLIQGELPLTELLTIVDPTYKPEPVQPEPVPVTPNQPEETSPVEPTLEDEGEAGQPSPSGTEQPTPKVPPAPEEASTEQETPAAPPSTEGKAVPEEVPPVAPTIEEEEIPTAPPSTETKPVPEEVPPVAPTIEEEEIPTAPPSTETKPVPRVEPSPSGEVSDDGPEITEEKTPTTQPSTEAKPVPMFETSPSGEAPPVAPGIEEEQRTD